ncbi:MAG TPA: HlyD family efflux transporter periplasmic adaptor subunit, partial [Gammaproteobacteria bacterium]|nr:HlyD family efflux transporter periplasmic adaptor subunit [Gammaproteobacteria bacterium]
FEITDESRLWVRARLTPEEAARVAIGARAWIEVNERRLPGRVIQTRHALDESTRTLAVRIEVENPDDRLHPGQFVQALVESSERETGLVVPLEAVLRSPDGDWQVLVETAPGRFTPREVTVLRSVDGRLVIGGLAEGTRIVTRGAFFVQSEIAKGGFEIHNH